MGLVKKVLAFMVMAALFGISIAAVYNVGDSSGWTIMGNLDYNKWASSKTFHVGDTIVFNYNEQFHNVMQVTHKDFQSCNATSAIVVYATGSDSITLERPGHYYYICGFPGHCEAGQKVDILVTPYSFLSASPIPSPPATPPSSATPPANPPSSVTPPANTPSSTPNTAASLYSSKLLLALTALVLVLTSFTY